MRMTSDMKERMLLRALFPRRTTHSLLRALELGLVPEQFKEQAVAILKSYPYPRNPKWALPARSEYNNGGWDNVVRALEEDR